MVINKNKAIWLLAGSESFENPSEALKIPPKSWKSSRDLENPPKILEILINLDLGMLQAFKFCSGTSGISEISGNLTAGKKSVQNRQTWKAEKRL